MKKFFKILIPVICAAVVVWLTVFVTDAVRTSEMKEPFFANPPAVTYGDGTFSVYQGIGYTVEVRKHPHPDYGLKIYSVEMKMFGKIITAVIE